MCRRGEIYYANLGTSTGSCQSGFRPVLVVSNDTANAHAPVITVVPITSQLKAMYMPTHVRLPQQTATGLKHTSIALIEQVTTIDKAQLRSYAGRICDERLLEKVAQALQVQLGIFPKQ